MSIRFVTKTLHAYIDYPVAASLIGTPFLLNLGQSNPLALWISVSTGVTALILTMFTNHKTGLVRVLPYSFHLLVDRLVGVVFVAAPFLLSFNGLDTAYYLINGLTVLLVTFVFNASEADQIVGLTAHA